MKKTTLILLSIFWSLGCAAHGTADNHLQIMIIDDRVKMNITVDMRVLKIVDEDKDGYAGLAELARQRESFRAWVEKSFDITDQAGGAGAVIFADVTSDLNIARELGERVDHARVVQTVRFDAVPRELRLDLSALATLVPELRVTIIDASSGLTYKLHDPIRPQSVPVPRNSNS